MKPIIILPPDAISDEDIKQLRENDLCVVVAKDPSAVKFVDPIPAMSSRTQIDRAAIALSRVVLNGHWGNYTNCSSISRQDAARIYVDCLTQGTPLAATYRDPEVVAKEIFDTEKANELRRLAREEAKKERATQKAKA